ncbi:MAG: class I SAM-dependent methyltransferase [Solirubrobacteraceae bacterium]
MSRDEERIAVYYDRLVERYGHDPRAVDAPSRESLDIRHAVLAELADMSGKSVLEVGCGFGDLGASIRERYDRVTYRGIDLSPRMVQEGRRVNPGLELEVGNVLDLPGAEAYDFVVAQGIFYLLREAPEERMREIVTRMFTLASEAIAFTAISAWAAERNPDEFYVDPRVALELGHSLTRSVVLRHDYHPGDLALYLYKRDWQ